MENKNSDNAYIWKAESGKFRGARRRFIETDGFKNYSSIVFQAEDGRVIHTLENIPGAHPTLGTYATRATVMLTTGCTWENAKPANAGSAVRHSPELSRKTAGQFKLSIHDNQFLKLMDTTTGAAGLIDHYGRAVVTYDSDAEPAKLIYRIKRLVQDLILDSNTSALIEYLPRNAEAVLAQSDGREYRAEIPTDATIAQARAAVILKDDGNLNYAELVNVKIEESLKNQIEAWLANK